MIAKKVLVSRTKKCAVKNECSVNIWHDASRLRRRRFPLLLPLALAIGDKELPSGSHEPVDELGNAEQAHAGEEAKSASCKGGKEYLANTAVKKINIVSRARELPCYWTLMVSATAVFYCN